MSAEHWLRYARLAYQLAQRCFPAYAHKYSPHKFTLAQLAACVLLKEYQHLDWRGIQALLELSPPLCQALKLKAVPDYSTLWRFARRWLAAQQVGQLLDQLAHQLSCPPVAVAVDSTGLDPQSGQSLFSSTPAAATRTKALRQIEPECRRGVAGGDQRRGRLGTAQ